MRISQAVLVDRLKLGASVKKLITDYNTTDRCITPNSFGTEYLIADSFKTKDEKAKTLFKHDRIRFFYDKNVSSAIAYVPFKKDNQTCCLVNITSHIRNVKNQGDMDHMVLDIPAIKITELLNAALYTMYVFDKDDLLSMAIGTESILRVYTDMWVGVLNRLVPSLASDKDNIPSVKYMIAKWTTLKNSTIYANDNTFDGVCLKISGVKEKTPAMELFDIENSSDVINTNTVYALLDILKRHFPQLIKLNINTMASTFSNMYGSNNTLTLEYITYCGSIIGSYPTSLVTHSKGLSKVLDKTLRKAYSDLSLGYTQYAENIVSKY